jgi:hypothetical protein
MSLPAARKAAATLASVCVACASNEASLSRLPSGAIGSCPATNTRPPPTTAWL